MSSEHVEVLRELRSWMASVYWDSRVGALDAAIASLSAPLPPAEAQEVVCLECGQPMMHMGQVCYACSHPAEAQPVAWTEKDGDEWIVYDADSDTGQHILNYQKDRHFRSVFPIYDHPPPSAPDGAVHDALQRDIDARGFAEIRQAELDALTGSAPSAPVGVEGWRVEPVEDDPDMLAVETPDGRTWFAKRGDRVFELAEALALSQRPENSLNDGNSEAVFVADDQQPAASDEAMARKLEGLARRWEGSASNDKDGGRRAAKMRCAADLLKLAAALAQQPAAVDEAMVERALNARYNGYDVACYIDEKADGRGVIRAALTAALAGQQGDSHD